MVNLIKILYKIFYIPTIILFIINIILMGLISFFNIINKIFVFVNNITVDLGDYCNAVADNNLSQYKLDKSIQQKNIDMDYKTLLNKLNRK